MSDEDLEQAPDSSNYQAEGEYKADPPEAEQPSANEHSGIVGPGSHEVGSLSPGTVVASPPNTGYVPERLEKAQELAEDEVGDAKEVDVDFTIVAHLDPRRQADPHGIYLDDVQRQQAEIDRARREGREPDLDNPPPYQGDTLIQTEIAKESGTYPGADFPVAFTAPVVVGFPAEDHDGDTPSDPAPRDPRFPE